LLFTPECACARNVLKRSWVAGLARTDQAGYGEEFHRISERLISGQKG